MAEEKSESTMTYEEKVQIATEVLRRNGYNEEEIAKILKLSFGEKPKEK